MGSCESLLEHSQSDGPCELPDINKVVIEKKWAQTLSGWMRVVSTAEGWLDCGNMCFRQQECSKWSFESQKHPDCEDGGKREEDLVRLTSYPKGRVELKKNGEWGTLCGFGWWSNGRGADIICKQLGYQWGFSYTDPGTDDEDRGPVIATNIGACRGPEKNVWACPH